MQKKKRKMLWLLCVMAFMLAVPVTAHAAASKASFKLSGFTKPSSIQVGSTFSLKGTITCSKTLKQVRVMILDSNKKKKLQLYTARPQQTTYNLANADPYMLFDRLKIGTYYLKIRCFCDDGEKNVVNKKFHIVGAGKIRIVNPKPSSNVSIAKGSSLNIGGTITSTYKLTSVTAAILNSNKKVVYKKSVNPKATSYTVGSVMDNAMLFDKLAAGKYIYRLQATDSQGQTAILINRTITVTGSGQETQTNVNTGTYLNTTEAVVVPAGYVARTGRPAATNKYYYKKSYNIYYGYAGLAPTGTATGGGYVLGNCTWYACGRAMEIVARAGGDIQKVKNIFGGDPVGIYKENLAKGLFKYGKTPKIGALAIFNYGASGDAHIAVVENIIDGVPYVSESGYTFGSTKPNAKKSNVVFKYQSIYNWAEGRDLLGYIYLLEPKG